MFKRILHKSITILGGAFLCIAVLSLVSCENFLKGADIRSQLEQAVEVANSNPVTIFVTPDENTGTAVPNQVQVKKSYEIILSFKPSGNYKFIKWEVLNRQTGEPVEGAIKFEDETALETKATVLKAIDNLVIHPKCILQPAVEKILPTPTIQNYTNASINIYFNMPMEPSAVNAVSISYFGTPVPEVCFEKPVLNADKTILIIKPQVINLTNFIENQNTSYVDLTVSISETATAQVEGISVPLVQNANSQFIFRYSILTETISPKQSDFFLSREEIKLDSDFTQVKKFHEDMVILDGTNGAEYEKINTEEKIVDNACGSYVYIYGKFLDPDSGVYKVSVFEQALGTYYDFDPQPVFLSEEYYSSSKNAEFTTDEAGVTTFRIKHYLKSQDGQVVIKCGISDFCGNTCETTQMFTYKITELGFFDSLYITNRYAFNYNGLKDNFDEDIYNEQIKTIYCGTKSAWTIDGWLELGYYFQSLYHIDCKYITKDGKEVTEPFVWNRSSDSFEITLNVDKLSGQHLIFLVSDVLGNTGEIECQIAESDNFLVMKLNEGGKIKASTYYSSGELVGNLYYLTQDTDGKIKFTEGEYDDFYTEMQSGYSYRFIPHHNISGKLFDGIHFFTEIPKKEYTIDNQSTETIPKISLLTPDTPANSYVITKNKKHELLDVTVKLAANTWDYDYDSIVLYAKDNALVSSGEDEGDEYSWVENGDKVVGFAKGQTECTVTVLTREMYESNCEIIIYGVKNSVSSEGTTLTITKFTKGDATYDNVFINFCTEKALDLNNLESYEYEIADNESGVATCYFIEGNYAYETYGNDWETAVMNERKAGKVIFSSKKSSDDDDYKAVLSRPLWFSYDTGYTRYLIDKAGNVTSYALPSFALVPDAKVTNMKMEGGVLVMTIKRTSKYFLKLYKAYSYYATKDSANKLKWSVYSENGTSVNLETSPSESTVSLTSFPAGGNFVKVVFDNDYRKCIASYIYTGTANTGTYDYVYPPSKNGVAVSSDAPVLCRTICTHKPYSECKDWTMYQWETKLRCIKEEVLNFSPSDPSSKIYKMAYEDTDLQGLCSVVMIYFADGTKTITSVVQN